MESNDSRSIVGQQEQPADQEVFDWLNLPPAAGAVSLGASLHDAQVVSIRSDLLARSMVLVCEIAHLRRFRSYADDFTFDLYLAGVQSARVIRYAVWPGGFSPPAGVTREEEGRLINEYQAKWRQESASWVDFEASVTPEDDQVFDISNVQLARSTGVLALNISGHLNHAAYHEIFLRCEALTISGSDGTQFSLEELQNLGQAYWEAFSTRETQGLG
jgi:hypothetical protein